MGATIGVFASPMIANNVSRFGGTFGVTLGAANQMRTTDAAASYMRNGVSLRLGASIGETSDLRAGDAMDSHSAVTRFLGLPSSEIGDKLENTGYRRSGVIAAARLPAGNSRSVSVSYRHSDMSDDHRYDQEIGGNGRYRSEFGPQVLDFGFVRYESARQSLVRRGVGHRLGEPPGRRAFEQQRPGQRIDQQANTTTAFGYAAQATDRIFRHASRALFGGEVFDEHIDGPAHLLEPNGTTVRARPDIPDDTSYRSIGLFWQQDADLIPNRLVGARRHSFRPLQVQERSRSPRWACPGRTFRSTDTTFNAAPSMPRRRSDAHRVGEPRLPRRERV